MLAETKNVATRLPAGLFEYSEQHREFVAYASNLPRTFDPMGTITLSTGEDVGFIMTAEDDCNAEMIFIFSDIESEHNEIDEWLFIAPPELNKQFNLPENVRAVIIDE